MKKFIKSRVIIVAVFCLVGIIVVGLCVTNNRFSPLSEEDIVYTLNNCDDVFSDYRLTINDYDIIRRQTNEELKTDYVWLSLDASNDIFSYHSDYELTFVLYNDGWILENFESNNKKFTATHPEMLTQSEADIVVSGMRFDKYTFAERIDEENRVSFVYFTEKSAFYLETIYAVTLVYNFSPSLTNPWGEPKVSVVEERRSADDLLGEWLYEDKNCRFYINIIDIDLKTHSVTLEYELENITIEGIMSDFTTNVYSGGVVTKDPNTKIDGWSEVSWSSNSLDVDYIKSFGGPSSMISIYFGEEVSKLSNPDTYSDFETGCGVWAGYHWLEKQS